MDILASKIPVSPYSSPACIDLIAGEDRGEGCAAFKYAILMALKPQHFFSFLIRAEMKSFDISS